MCDTRTLDDRYIISVESRIAARQRSVAERPAYPFFTSLIKCDETSTKVLPEKYLRLFKTPASSCDSFILKLLRIYHCSQFFNHEFLDQF